MVLPVGLPDSDPAHELEESLRNALIEVSLAAEDLLSTIMWWTDAMEWYRTSPCKERVLQNSSSRQCVRRAPRRDDSSRRHSGAERRTYR